MGWVDGGLYGFHDDDDERSGFLGCRGGRADHDVGCGHCHRADDKGAGGGRRAPDSVPDRSIELLVVVSPVVARLMFLPLESGMAAWEAGWSLAPQPLKGTTSRAHYDKGSMHFHGKIRAPSRKFALHFRADEHAVSALYANVLVGTSRVA